LFYRFVSYQRNCFKMKNKTLLTAGLVILISTCIFAVALSVKPVKKEVYIHSKALVQAVEADKHDDEPGEFIIWKAIPRYLFTIYR
jgi:hypothetical protein